jgi:hypothetical protein
MRAYPKLMSALVEEVIEAELLEEEGQSGVSNQIINTMVRHLGCLSVQSLSINTQLQATKAQLREANTEMREALKGQKR